MSAASATAPSATTPDVNVSGMTAGDANVRVSPTTGGGLILSPLPVGGRRGRKTAKKTAGRRRRRGGAEDEVAPAPAAMGARRRKTAKKSRKAGRR